MASPTNPPPERRLLGRVPFVRRCALSFANGRSGHALLVNINTVGAYVAHDDLGGVGASLEPPPQVGDLVTCRFGLPDRADEVELQAVVTWVNARQSHPVHSLPPGFGLTFRRLSPHALAAIEQVMADAARTMPE
jgi:PilZ domain-containing protein